jgi:hypothetical protein
MAKSQTPEQTSTAQTQIDKLLNMAGTSSEIIPPTPAKVELTPTHPMGDEFSIITKSKKPMASKFRVSLPELKPIVVEASDKWDAFETYKQMVGVVSTAHTPVIEETDE